MMTSESHELLFTVKRFTCGPAGKREGGPPYGGHMVAPGGEGSVPLLTSIPGFCFFHLVRRFWNQILTCKFHYSDRYYKARLRDFPVKMPTKHAT